MVHTPITVCDMTDLHTTSAGTFTSNNSTANYQIISPFFSPHPSTFKTVPPAFSFRIPPPSCDLLPVPGSSPKHRPSTETLPSRKQKAAPNVFHSELFSQIEIDFLVSVVYFFMNNVSKFFVHSLEGSNRFISSSVGT